MNFVDEFLGLDPTQLPNIPKLLPAQRVSRLREPTADVFDAEYEDEWAQSENIYGDVWNSKGLKTTNRILQKEIIQIQNEKNKYKRRGKKVPPKLAQQLRDAKAAFT